MHPCMCRGGLHMGKENHTDAPVVSRIRSTWTKLNDTDLSYYARARNCFIGILASKYAFTRKQAEEALSNIERITHSR